MSKVISKTYVGGLHSGPRVEVRSMQGGLLGGHSVGSQAADSFSRDIHEPISWTAEPFPGIGDYSDAQNLISNVRGVVADATRVISQRIAGLELEVSFEVSKDGTKELMPASDHPLQTLLDNPTLRDGSITHSAMQTWALAIVHLLNAGEAYILIVKDGLGVPENLYIMKPGSTRPIIEGGRIVAYETRTGMGNWFRMESTDVIRIWEPDPENIYAARGILSKHAQTFDLDLYVKQHWANWFKNDATPKVTLETDDASETLPSMEDREAFDESWFRRMHRRLGHRVGLPYMLKPGWHAKTLKSQDEADQGVKMMTYTRNSLLEAYGVPPSKLGDVVDVNRAAAETNDYVFDRNTIEPLSRMLVEALTNQLGTQYPQPDNVRLVVTHKQFISPDKEFELSRDVQDAQAKIRSVNEIRRDRTSPDEDVDWGELPIGTIADIPYSGEEREFPTNRPGTVEVEERVSLDAMKGEASLGESLFPSLVLNGAQVTALVDVVGSVMNGLIPYGSAMEIIQSAFAMSQEKASKILGSKSNEGKNKEDPIPAGTTKVSGDRTLMVAPKNSLDDMRQRFSPEREWRRQVRREERWFGRYESRMRSILRKQKEDILDRLNKSAILEATNRSDFVPTDPSMDIVRKIARELFNPIDWEKIYDTADSILKRAFMDSGAEVLDQLGVERSFEISELAERLISNQNKLIFKFTTDTTTKVVERVVFDALKEGWGIDKAARELAKSLGLRMKDARMIAQTEIGAAQQAAQLEGYRQSGVVQGKMWTTALDNRVRDSHMIEGQVRSIDEDFELRDGAFAPSPRSEVLEAGDRINCRCIMVPIMMGEDPSKIISESIAKQKKIMDKEIFKLEKTGFVEEPNE